MEYNHEQAVADRVNVDFDVYSIRTLISEHGSAVNAGFPVDKRDRLTRKVRWEQLEDDLRYPASRLDRDVVAPDQIRTIIRTFKERLFTQIFPGRTVVPKTLIFAKDDSHADDIVQIVREEFGKGNDFAQKITHRTGTARRVEKKTRPDGTEYEEVTWVNSGVKAEDLLSSFRNSYNPEVRLVPSSGFLFPRRVRRKSFLVAEAVGHLQVLTPFLHRSAFAKLSIILVRFASAIPEGLSFSVYVREWVRVLLVVHNIHPGLGFYYWCFISNPMIGVTIRGACGADRAKSTPEPRNAAASKHAGLFRFLHRAK